MDKASTRDTHVAQLSNRVLNMKFMQRGKDAEDKNKIEEERKKAALEAQWVIDFDLDEIKSTGLQVEEDHSYLSFMEAAPLGRKSFNGFNKEIEIISSAMIAEQKLRESEEREKKNSVTDIEMARHMGAISRKNGKGLPDKSPGDKRKRETTNGDSATPSKARKTEAGKGPNVTGSEHGTASRFKFLKPS
ncbi:M-phase phosphoprotein 6 [Dinochytrium kinnereticum]|nr:M-phase phosphoprotein 6 [Dinochytrium kinnereticum]